MQAKDGVIEVRPVRQNLREGLARDRQDLAMWDDAPQWPAFGNEDDAPWLW